MKHIILLGTGIDATTERAILEAVATKLVQVQRADKVKAPLSSHKKSHKKFTPYCWLGKR